MTEQLEPLKESPVTAYRTGDLYYAAYLKVAGVPFLGTEREGQRVIFLFEERERGSLRSLRDQYFNDQSRVPALSYAQAIKTLKGLVFR
jgi:hypothetical protein